MDENDQERHQPLLTTYYENCPGCQIDLSKETNPRIPFKLLFYVWVIVLCAALPISSLFPFLYFMIRDFHVAKREEDIGYYAGYVGSAYMFGRALTSVLWGAIADRYGRKPVIIFGIITLIIFNTLFGLSTSFWMAISMRFFLGSLSGILGPMRAYASEVCRKEYQALGMSIISTSWGIGLVIGPALGGFLAQVTFGDLGLCSFGLSIKGNIWISPSPKSPHRPLVRSEVCLPFRCWVEVFFSVLFIGTVHGYCSSVLFTGTVHRYCSRVLFIGAVHGYCSLVLFTSGTVHAGYCFLILCFFCCNHFGLFVLMAEVKTTTVTDVIPMTTKITEHKLNGSSDQGILISADEYAQFIQYQASLKSSNSSITTIAESGNSTACLVSSSSKWVIDSGATDHMSESFDEADYW